MIAMALLLMSMSVGDTGAPKGRAPTPSTYCGVQSLARAVRSYGEKVEFSDLLKPVYISSRRGSSSDDLVQAANDLGFYASVQTRLNCFILANLDCPVILHVKSQPSNQFYDHWILFCGMKEFKAVIYDADKDAEEVSLEDLSAIWDGTGILIEKGQSNQRWVLALFLTQFVFASGLLVFLVSVGLKTSRRCFPNAQQGWSKTLAESASIGILVGILLLSSRFVGAGGFLSSSSANQNVQESFLSTFLPTISASELDSRSAEPDVVVIDGRSAASFAEAHYPGSLNLPFYLSLDDAKKVLDGKPQTARLIVYCESYHCRDCSMVARTLTALGFSDLAFVREGWKGLESRLQEPGS